MRSIPLLFILLLSASTGYCQDFTAKSWAYSSITVVFDTPTDSVNLFSKTSTNNRLAIGAKNFLLFYRDSTYRFTLNDSVTVNGKWYFINTNALVMDSDTLEIVKRTAVSLGFKGKYTYLDGSGSFKFGSIITYFSLLAEDIQSIKIGNWNDSSTWSTGRIPNSGDNVTIKQNHKVTLLPNETAYCKKLVMEKGAIFDSKSLSRLAISE